uniref:Reverse transcriptase zinc-binding domain-containing protein n=1 Tax=Arundo donax TaxID=35708 RepID=A0A0A8YCP8_ARUDO
MDWFCRKTLLTNIAGTSHLTESGSYTSKSAYNAFFLGSIKFAPWRTWKTWALLRCKFFIWLAINNRCWTADRLAKRNLPHPAACPLCDQAESIQHILVSCVFARQVWTIILQRLDLLSIAPQATARRFSTWWSSAARGVPKEMRKGLNSLIILVVWELWKHRNDIVFNGATPSISGLLQTVANECALWCMAGASSLSELLMRSLPPGA